MNRIHTALWQPNSFDSVSPAYFPQKHQNTGPALEQEDRTSKMASGTTPLPRLRATPQEPGLLAGILASEMKSSWAEWGAGEAPPAPR